MGIPGLVRCRPAEAAEGRRPCELSLVHTSSCDRSGGRGEDVHRPSRDVDEDPTSQVPAKWKLYNPGCLRSFVNLISDMFVSVLFDGHVWAYPSTRFVI